MNRTALCALLAMILPLCTCGRSPMAPPPDSASSWSLFATSDNIVDVSGSSSSDVYALGERGVLYHYDGSGWTASLALQERAPGPWDKIWCASPTDIFLFGASIYHWDGVILTLLAADLPTRIFRVWGSSRDNVYALGGVILHFDGSSWTQVDSPTSAHIVGITGLSSGEVFIATAKNVFSRLGAYSDTPWREILTAERKESISDIAAASDTSLLAMACYAYTDAASCMNLLRYDGESWTRETLWDRGCYRRLWATTEDRYYFFDPDGDFGVWGSGIDLYVAETGWEAWEGHLRHWDGIKWQREAEQWRLQEGPFTAIAGSDHDLYVAGYEELHIYDGSSWRHEWAVEGELATDIWVDDDFSFATSAEEAVLLANRTRRTFDGAAEGMRGVWGASRTDVFMVGSGGRIAHFDGDSCQPMVSPTTGTLQDVWGRSGAEVYAVGDDGTILRYNGQAWQPMESHTSESLYAVWGNSEGMYAVGALGTILRLENSEWVPMNSPSALTLTGIWGFSNRDIYAVGANAVLHFDGSRWEILTNKFGGKQIWGRSSDDLYINDGGKVLHYGTNPPR